MTLDASKVVSWLSTILWVLVVMFLWCTAILGPILIVLCLASLFSYVRDLEINGFPLTSQAFLAIYLALFVLASIIAWSYILHYRRIILNQTPGIRQAYTIIVLLFLLLFSWVMNWNCRAELHAQERLMEQVQLYEVTISGFDAETRKPVPISLTLLGQRDPWPRIVGVTGSAPNCETLRWLAVGPEQVKVAADGYVTQRPTIDLDAHKTN